MSLSSNLRLIVGAVALLLVATMGHAALAQQNPPPAQLTVTAQVDASCTLNGGTLPFGFYTGEQNDATGEFFYECTDDTHIVLSLDQGANEQDGERTMLGDSGGSLPYELYSDSNRSTVWGVGENGFDIAATSANPETAQVFGRIAAGLQAPAGNYTDTVQITLEIQ